MKKVLMPLALLLIGIFQIAAPVHAQQFKWVKGGGTSEDFSSLPSWESEQVKYMCTDPNGNVYVLSQVGNNPVIADTFHGLAHGDDINMLITSYNCSGQMRWAKLIASSAGDCIPYGIAADSTGHIYVAGYMANGTLYIGADTTIPGLVFQDEGLIQFDTAGHFHWVRYVGDNTISSLTGSWAFGSTLVIDGANNAHFLNYMKHGVHITPSLTSVGGTYDLVYNTSGTLLSDVRLDLDSEWFLHGAVIDSATNKLYVYGEINQGIYGGFLTDTFYAAAFDASRNRLWMYFAGHGDDDGFSGIVIDKAKNLYFCGGAQGVSGPPTFSFHGDSVVGSGEMAVIIKADTNGVVKWMRHYDCIGSSINGFVGIAALPNYKIVAGGAFAGTVTNGTTTLTVPSTEGENSYLVIIDSGSNQLTMQQIHGNAGAGADAIAADKVGNVYLGGFEGDSVWAGTPAIPAYHTTGGNSDFYVMKYGVDCSCTSAPIAAFTDTGTHTLGVIYTGTTSGVDSIVWNFGDGYIATGTTALHTYSASGTYHVCVTVYTTCGSDIHCSDVTIHIHTLLEPSVIGQVVKVFPNPANDELNISGVLENTNYRLLSVTGVCVAQGILQQGSNTVPMRECMAGVYILELSNNGDRNIIRVVKE